MSAIRRRWRFTGTVQGVGFRYYARAAALHLGLTGWVANNWDGSVTLEVDGDRVGVSAVEETNTLLVRATRCLDAIDRVLDAQNWGDEAFSAYVALNSEFHDILLEMSGSSFMQRELERVKRLPFASPSGFVVADSESPRALRSLILAQEQHREVIDAIEHREGARAEALMKEHSRIARRNLREAMRSPETTRVPGAQLIRASR